MVGANPSDMKKVLLGSQKHLAVPDVLYITLNLCLKFV